MNQVCVSLPSKIVDQRSCCLRKTVEALESQTGIPKGLKKIRSSGVEEWLTILEFGGHEGGVWG